MSVSFFLAFEAREAYGLAGAFVRKPLSWEQTPGLESLDTEIRLLEYSRQSVRGYREMGQHLYVYSGTDEVKVNSS